MTTQWQQTSRNTGATRRQLVAFQEGMRCSKSICLQEKLFLCEEKFTEQLKSN